MSDITRSEAIELLKSLRFEDDETCSENMAVDMAIASLETDEAYDLMYEQPEFCKNCISREAVEKITWEEPKYTDALNALTEVREKVRALPPVLPKADVPDNDVRKIGSTTKDYLGVDYLGVDCISRDEVCCYVAEFVNHEFSTREEEELIDNIITGIEHLPPATPQEPRKGHWFIDERPESNREVICSNCEQPVFKYHKLDFDYRPKYCPNCGADMREVEE